jgi:hypothetical protein
MASNQRISTNLSRGELKEQNIVCQFDKKMVTTNHEVEPTSIGMDDTTSHYAHC